MSNLSPGGSRNKFGGRVYGADNIKRAIRAQKPDHGAGAKNSIADKPHLHSREVERRRRQEERKAQKHGR